MSPASLGALRSSSVVLVTGEDARKFLQGQLCNDVRKLTPERALLAGCTSAQGRVMAVVTLIERPSGIFAILPSAAVEPVIGRMRRMVLRAKIAFEVQPAEWAVAPVSRSAASALFDTLPEQPGQCVSGEHATLLRWWSRDERFLLLGERAALGVSDEAGDALDAQWQRADVSSGLPAVYPATRDAFVPQMLNLDRLDALSYDKGCYVGQEVVARAKRAQVKRRMFRFEADCAPPAPGTPVQLASAEVGAVVDAAATPGGCELLAVVEIERSTGALCLPAGEALRPLDLPYLTA